MNFLKVLSKMLRNPKSKLKSNYLRLEPFIPNFKNLIGPASVYFCIFLKVFLVRFQRLLRELLVC